MLASKTENIKERIKNIDFIRGLVMIIMALDHIRDLIFTGGQTQDPTNLTTTTEILFFTRWITHICAPIFVFLSGVSAWLSLQSKDIKSARRFLITRGIWLLILEFTVITFGIWSDVKFQVFLFQVIAAIGFCFILLGLFIKVRAKILGYTGLIIIFCYQLLALLPAKPESLIVKLITPLFAPNLYTVGTKSLLLAYPPIPWFGIMLCGFGFAYLFIQQSSIRKKIFFTIGTVSLLLFIIMRFINIYGDPAPWSVQKNTMFTILSFINISKYPPSLLYCLVTLGIMFLLLSLSENRCNKFMKIISVYGKVPLFYYLLHWYLIHISMYIILFTQGFSFNDFRFGFDFGRPKAENGLTLFGTYLIWILLVALLYPACNWYGKLKNKHPQNWWLKYL